MKLIHFIPQTGDYDIPKPEKASKFIPDWYKNAESNYEHKGQNVKGLKACIPFLDLMLSGYMLLTWNDIEVVKQKDGKTKINWLNNENISTGVVQEREGLTGHTIPRPPGHLENHLVWQPQWGWKTSKGYSSIITHPYNRFDLPFTTMSGLVDSDKFWSAGNIPFFLKENFEGVIPKGTPFAQIIPVKRKSWSSVYNPALINITNDLAIETRKEDSFYKKKKWIKKDYR